VWRACTLISSPARAGAAARCGQRGGARCRRPVRLHHRRRQLGGLLDKRHDLPARPAAESALEIPTCGRCRATPAPTTPSETSPIDSTHPGFPGSSESRVSVTTEPSRVKSAAFTQPHALAAISVQGWSDESPEGPRCCPPAAGSRPAQAAKGWKDPPRPMAPAPFCLSPGLDRLCALVWKRKAAPPRVNTIHCPRSRMACLRRAPRGERRWPAPPEASSSALPGSSMPCRRQPEAGDFKSASMASMCCRRNAPDKVSSRSEASCYFVGVVVLCRVVTSSSVSPLRAATV
jgi:hypothetical protein